MDILYKLFQEHQMMLLSSTTTTPLPLPYGSDVQCGRSWKNDTLGKVEKILKGRLDSIPSPSVKIQIIGGKFYLE